MKRKRLHLGRNCCVPGCKNRQRENRNLSFFSFPNRPWEAERKMKWIASVCRETKDNDPWMPTKYSRICSAHFLGGVKSNDPRKEAYIPTVFPWNSENSAAFEGVPKLEDQTQSRARKKKEINLENDTPPLIQINFEKIVDETAIKTEYPEFAKIEIKSEYCDDIPEITDSFQIKTEPIDAATSEVGQSEIKAEYENMSEVKTEICEVKIECHDEVVKWENLEEETIAKPEKTNFIECEICGKAVRKTNIKYHSLMHSGEKPHECDICGRRFAILPMLKKHSTTHNDEKPFSCASCDKSFRSNDDLKVHNRIHTGEKLQECQLCHKKYTYTGEKPLSCSVCQKSFPHCAQLTYHMRMHTGDRRYKCEVCNKSLTGNAQLKSHSRIHTGTKPYSCTICEKSYSRHDSLKNHMKTCRKGT